MSKSLGSLLKLSLEVEKRKFVVGESIPLTISLENIGSKNIKINDLSEKDDSIYIRIIGDKGSHFSGTLLSWLEREGIPYSPALRQMAYFKSKGKKIISVDLTKIIGIIPEDRYRIKASYSSHGILVIDSNVVALKIFSANPIYCMSPKDDQRYLSNSIRTAWINKEKGGYGLFILESSPNIPDNIWANKRITQFDGPKEVHLSLLESYDQQIEHALWVDQDRLFILIRELRNQVTIKDFNLNLTNLKILDPSFTSEDGTLACLITSHDGKVSLLSLFTLSLNNQITLNQLYQFNGLLDEYSIISDRNKMIHIICTIKGDLKCYYLKIDRDSKVLYQKNESTIFLENSFPMFGLKLSNVCTDYNGRYFTGLHFMSQETKGKLHSRIFNLESKEEFSNYFFPIAYDLKLTLLDVILDSNSSPHYLFQDKGGSLWYQSLKAPGLEKVTEENEVCPGNVGFPILIMSSENSRYYGIFLRYIKDGSTFFYKKLEVL